MGQPGREGRSILGWLGSARTDPALRGTLHSIVAGGGLQLVVAASGIIAARLLGVTDRGHLALLWVVTLATGQLSTLGLHVSIAYHVAAGLSPAEVCGRLRGLIAAQLLLSVTAGAAVIVAVGDVSGQTPASLGLAMAVPPCFVLLLHGLALAQGQRKYPYVQLHRLVAPSLYVLLLIVLAATGNGRLSAVTAGWGATMIVGGLFAWRQCLGAWWPAPVRLAQPEPGAPGSPGGMLRFGVRSLFSAFGLIEHLQADQLLVGLLLSASQFGLYVAGAAFANLPRFLGQSVGYIAYPEVTAATRPERGRAIRRFLSVGAAVLLPVVLVLIAGLGWLLPLLFGHAFRPAVTAGRILLGASLLQALRRVAAEGLRGLGSGLSASVAELAFIAVFVGTLVPLTSSHHVEGAALAQLIASVAGVLVLFLLAGRLSRPAKTSPAPSQDPLVALGAGEPPHPS
jgi:O-antigen/teichoic acid export membrane protein